MLMQYGEQGLSVEALASLIEEHKVAMALEGKKPTANSLAFHLKMKVDVLNKEHLNFVITKEMLSRMYSIYVPPRELDVCLHYLSRYQSLGRVEGLLYWQEVRDTIMKEVRHVDAR